MRDVARECDMSESSLYHNFKIVTSLSPVAFQKIHLEQAKICSQNIGIAQAIFDVVDESAHGLAANRPECLICYQKYTAKFYAPVWCKFKFRSNLTAQKTKNSTAKLINLHYALLKFIQKPFLNALRNPS